MKFFLLFLISFSVLSSAFSETPMDQVSREKAKKLNSLYSGVDSYCDKSGHHADLIAECKKIKEVIKVRYYEAILSLVDKEVKDGLMKARSDYKESQCVAAKRAELASLGGSFNGSETCTELQFAIDAL